MSWVENVIDWSGPPPILVKHERAGRGMTHEIRAGGSGLVGRPPAMKTKRIGWAGSRPSVFGIDRPACPAHERRPMASHDILLWQSHGPTLMGIMLSVQLLFVGLGLDGEEQRAVV